MAKEKATPEAAVESDQPEKGQELDAKLREDMARAIAASQSRLAVAPVHVRGRPHPQKEFIAEFAPECVGPEALFHPFLDEVKNHSLNLSKGYIPVPDPTTKRQAVSPDGQYLYKLPRELHRRNLAEVSDRSAAILRASAKEAQGEKRDAKGAYGSVKESVSVVQADSIDAAVAESEHELAKAG